MRGMNIVVPTLALPARRQFPIKIAFAMTINKAQDQTLKHMGLYLPQSVFSHGQLYVALARVGSKEQVVVYVICEGDDPTTSTYSQNIVYREIFEEELDVAGNMPDSEQGFASDAD